MPDRPIGSLEILAPAERASHPAGVERHRARGPARDAAGSCLPRRWRGPRTRLPRCSSSSSLSYRELDARSSQLAHHLRAHGVGPEVVVGLCIERSLEMLIGLLGILKAGGAYLPLDPDYPPERLAFMLADARAPLLVTTTALRARLPDNRGPHHLPRCRGRQPSPRSPPPHRKQHLRPHNPAYVIYTSGSTGTPKGVAVTHSGIPNLAIAQIDRFAITSEARVLQFASPSFDAAISEIATVSDIGCCSRSIRPLSDIWRLSRRGVIYEQDVSHATLPPVSAGQTYLTTCRSRR